MRRGSAGLYVLMLLCSGWLAFSTFGAPSAAAATAGGSVSADALLGRPAAARPQIAGGYAHTVAVRADGSLYAWGDNRYGQLGDGTTVDKSRPTRIGSDSDWVAAACGRFYTVALRLGFERQGPARRRHHGRQEQSDPRRRG
jgi:hypothetical protein